MSIKRTFQMTPKNDKRTGAYRACCSGPTLQLSLLYLRL